MQSVDTALAKLYEQDFDLWIASQVTALKECRYEDLDLTHLIEEVEDLSKRDRQELRSRLRVLLMHLLKWEFQPDQRSNSWRSTIRVQRNEIEDIFSKSPSLRNSLSEAVISVYEQSRKLAADETGLSPTTFPQESPYSTEQLLDEGFLPEKVEN